MNETYPEKLERVMRERNWTQGQLGELLGVPQAQISDWITGRHAVSRLSALNIDSCIAKLEEEKDG